MKRHRHTPEQIIRKIPGREVAQRGKDRVELLRHLEVSEATWNRWRSCNDGRSADHPARASPMIRFITIPNMRLCAVP